MLTLRSQEAIAPAVPVPVLTVRGLTASYDGRRVLDGLDLDVQAGELVALLGANGSGKSTALRCIAGLRSPDGGRVDVAGERPVVGRTAAVVFQQPHLVRRRTALDNVCTGALGRLALWRSVPSTFPRELRAHAMACLDRVGLADRATERAGRLSGGQQQRVAVARALCQGAPLLLADEPVSALDPRAADQVLALLADLAHNDGLAVLVVLHQPELAQRYADRLVGLRDGRVAFASAARAVNQRAVRALYAEGVAP